MEKLHIDELLYKYPKQDSKRVQSTINNKKEFTDVKSIKNESQIKKLKKGEFYNHQKFVHRYMNIYDSLLLYAEPGTGKSGSSLGFSEKLKRDYRNFRNSTFVHNYLNNNNPHINRTYVLSPSKIVLNQIKEEIKMYYSEPGDYDIMFYQSESGRKKKLTNMLKNYYGFYSYSRFAKQISKLTDRELVSKFNNCLFILDEIHMLRITNIDNIKYALGNDRALSEERIKKMKEKRTDKVLTYRQIRRLFMLLDRKKIILQTATPIVNYNYEIVTLMNLILPQNGQLRINVNYEYKNFNTNLEKYLAKKIRGTVSHVRKEESVTYIRYEGEKDEYSGLILYYTPMGIIQATAYQYAIEKYIGKETYVEKSLRKKRDTAFANDIREISLMVYPDGSFGNLPNYGFNKYIRYTDQKAGKTWNWDSKNQRVGKFPIKYIVEFDEDKNPIYVDGLPSIIPYDAENDFYEMNLTFNDYLENSHLFSELSGKYVDILRRVERNINLYNNILQPYKNLPYEGPQFGFGTFYIYSESVTGSGIYPFTLFLEKNEILKFELFNIDLNYFTKNPLGDEVLDTSKISKRLRYAVLTESTPPKLKTAIMDVFKSSENVYGDYIKVLLISPIGQVGISLKHVVETHIVTPPWSLSITEQAINRSDRVDSSTVLIHVLSHLEDEDLFRIHNSMNFQRPIIDDFGFINFELKFFLHVADYGQQYPLDYPGRYIYNFQDIKDYDPEEGVLPPYFHIPKYKELDEDIEEDFEDNPYNIDYYIYTRSQDKNKVKMNVLNMFKSIAVDCQLNKDRNTRADEEQIECFFRNIPAFGEKYDSFLLLYSQELILKIYKKIENIFQQLHLLEKNYYSIHVTDLYNLIFLDDEDYEDILSESFEEFKVKIIDLSIEYCIINKILFKNNIGFDYYLYQNNGFLFILPLFPEKLKQLQNFTLNYEYIPKNYQNNLDVFMKKQESIKEKGIFDEIKLIDNKEDIVNKINTLSLTKKIEIVEHILETIIQNIYIIEVRKRLIDMFNLSDTLTDFEIIEIINNKINQTPLITQDELILNYKFLIGDFDIFDDVDILDKNIIDLLSSKIDLQFYETVILNMFSKYIMFDREPIEKIEKYKIENVRFKVKDIKRKNKTIQKIVRVKGRPVDEDKKIINIPNMNIETIESINQELYFENVGKIMIYHDLNIFEKRITKYNINHIFAKGTSIYRIFNYDSLTFQDMNEAEIHVYNTIIQLKEYNKLKVFRNTYPIYGIIFEGNFKIANSYFENKDDSKEDTRKRFKGRNCTSWTKENIIFVLWKLNIETQQQIDTSKLSYEEMLDFLTININLPNEIFINSQGNMYKKKIKFYYKWYNTRGFSVKKACVMLKTYFEENNMLYISEKGFF